MANNYPRDPSIQMIPTLALKSVNMSYIGLFGSLGVGTLDFGTSSCGTGFEDGHGKMVRRRT